MNWTDRASGVASPVTLGVTYVNAGSVPGTIPGHGVFLARAFNRGV